MIQKIQQHVKNVTAIIFLTTAFIITAHVNLNVMMAIMQIQTKSVNNAILIVKHVQRVSANIVMMDMN